MRCPVRTRCRTHSHPSSGQGQCLEIRLLADSLIWHHPQQNYPKSLVLMGKCLLADHLTELFAQDLSVNVGNRVEQWWSVWAATILAATSITSFQTITLIHFLHSWFESNILTSPIQCGRTLSLCKNQSYCNTTYYHLPIRQHVWKMRIRVDNKWLQLVDRKWTRDSSKIHI